jgi:hypothetical protein
MKWIEITRHRGKANNISLGHGTPGTDPDLTDLNVFVKKW